MKHLSPLTEIGWLATQPPPFQEVLERAGRWRVFGRGVSLYQAGEQPEALFGLGVGALEVLVPVSRDELVTVHRAEPGFWVGESGMLAGGPRTISIVAAAESRVFCVPAAAIRGLLKEQPEFWPCFYMLTHANASQIIATLAELLAFSPEARLARMLLRLADANGEIKATQSDLARLLGVTRSSLQRALGHILDGGALVTGYGVLKIVDRAALQGVVEHG